VIFTYYKYQNLIDSIFFLFQVEANQEARSELTRLIGVLGALDCFYLFKHKAIYASSEVNLDNAALLKIIKGNHKSNFFFESKPS
jgi:hypothetical protein